MRPRYAFTLLELLIVLAILALIVGLLLPALSGVRRRGHTAKCLSKLRSLEQAHWLYMGDNKSRFIDAGLPHNNLPDETAAWINTLQTYYDNRLVLRSPADDSPHWPGEIAGGGTPIPGSNGLFRRTSYGLNNYLTQFSPAAAIDPSLRADRLSKVGDPVATVHFLVMVFHDEQGYCGSDHVHVEEWWNQAAGANFPPVQAASQMQTNAHGGPPASWDSRSNYAFLDGHVETLPFRSVYINRDKLNLFDPEVSRFVNVRTTLGQ